ncbi:MAG: DUF3137 domain-containing protein [Alphaproteobacteria bacterium]|nr:DUF3137 domain-containing protein [Alphaproteobacteria bacterium]
MTDLFHTTEYADLKKRFDLYYEATLLPILQQNDKVRKRYLISFMVLILMAILFYPAMLYLLFNNNIAKEYIGLSLCGSCVVIMLACGPMYFYKKRVKPQIMPEFANFFGKFSYVFEGKIDDEILRASSLFTEYNNSVGDDYFSGIYDGVHISIAEEKLLKIHRTRTRDGQKTETNKPIFSGVCILFEMNKKFSGHTVVLKDRGALGNSFYKIKGLKNVRLEDSVFEKYFEVFSDNQIEARYLLTTAFMERMLKLRDLYEGKSIQFSFKFNRLLLSVPTHQDMFEANSFFKSNLNKQKIDLVFEQFYTIFSIVKLLKLNQRIGI